MGRVRLAICVAIMFLLFTGCSDRQSIGTQVAFEKPVDTILELTPKGFYTLTTSELFDYKREFIYSGDSLVEIKEVFEPHEGFDISDIGAYTDGDFAPSDLTVQEDGSYCCCTTSGSDFEALSDISRQQLYEQFKAAFQAAEL